MTRFGKPGTRLALLLALASLPAWQHASAQREVGGEGPYFHGPARAQFPVQVGGFRRSQVYRYDREGKDVSAAYELATPQGRLLITVYIYPAAPAAAESRARLCDSEFDAVNSAISSQHGNAVPGERGAAVPVEGVESKLGHRSVYRFSSRFGDHVQALRSEAHLYCYVGGDWLVKYRVTAPVAVETPGPVADFIRNGPWPGRSST